jgi:hypothetical protein
MKPMVEYCISEQVSTGFRERDALKWLHVLL